MGKQLEGKSTQDPDFQVVGHASLRGGQRIGPLFDTRGWRVCQGSQCVPLKERMTCCTQNVEKGDDCVLLLLKEVK